MTNAQESHLRTIIQEASEMIGPKYRAGVQEHGGNLWEMTILDLVENSLKEAIDLVVYLLTLRTKLRNRVGKVPGDRL